MRLMQRVVLILLLVIGLMLGTAGEWQRRNRRLQEQWGMVQTERLLQRICRTGKCSYEDYYFFHLLLCYCGMDAEIRIEEYQKEQDKNGVVYYHLIPWEELRDSFQEENSYEFAKESMVRITVKEDDIMDIELWRKVKDDL